MKLSLYTKVNPVGPRLVKGHSSANVPAVSKIAASSYHSVGLAGPVYNWQDAAFSQRNQYSVLRNRRGSRMSLPSTTGRRVVIAPDKFKGSLTPGEAARAMALGVKRADRELTTVECPVADGGDGTLDTAVAAGFERVPVYATGPTGQVVLTAYARSGETAVVEMAEVCGLQRLPGAKAAPMTPSSYGLGEVVAQALDHGCPDIIIGVGGSASTDGGAGFLAALGAIARDEHGSRLDSGGRHIGSAAQLDVTGLHPEIASAAFTIAVDVDNPLYGPLGAAMV